MPDVDWDFIAEREGKGVTGGYVPTDTKTAKVLGKSGVTVGTGFDIGQRSGADIDKLDISKDLKDKLKPFAALKGDDAVKALNDYKTTNKKDFALTDAEVEELDLIPKKKDFETLKSNYNKAVATTEGASQFEQLPSGIQTAIASLAFQYGVNFAKLGGSKKEFWDLVTTQNWEDAAKKLEAFGDVYKTRRKLEAGKLRDGIKELPAAAPAEKK